MKQVVWTVVLCIAAAVVSALLFIYSGVFNVAATSPDGRLMRWALSTTKDKSIERRAKMVRVPSLTDPELISAGFLRYHRMCEGCHGAPGVERHEGVKNFNPEPPELVDRAKELSEAELYWITKNGIKMTGMPAMGSTINERELWAVVAFMKRLPSMPALEYGRLAAAAPKTDKRKE